MRGTYSYAAVEEFINGMCNRCGYDYHELEEGTLGAGHVVLWAPDDDHYNYEIEEVYLNEWSSGHKVRAFSKISKRLQKAIDASDNCRC